MQREVVDVAALAADLRARATQAERVLVGICGAPGAGKSTLVGLLVAELGDEVAVAPMDGFHLAAAVIAEDDRATRRGAPDTFDPDGFAALLERLRANTDETVYAPDYRREIEDPVAGAIPIRRDCPIVLTEGNYLLHPGGGWRRARACLDAVWYLEPPNAAVRIERLIARHERFGKSPQAARAHVLGSDERNAALVAGHRDRADRWLYWSNW